MNHNEELYRQYELLLPSKYEGGYLVLALYEKIRSKEMPKYFTDADVSRLLQQLAVRHKQSVWQTDRILRNLNHFFIKSVPDQFGKYYLSDYAIRVVEMVINKLKNPYKNYPLKDTFEKYFHLREGQIKVLNDLEVRYGRDFVAPHKSIIENHVDGLQDELEEAHQKLTGILMSEELTAIQMVHQFVSVFTKFGERAEDISNAISSKDRFLKSLAEEVDKFYQKMMDSDNPEGAEAQAEINRLSAEWLIAAEIHRDLTSFFENVDVKLAMVHKQILYATEKLYELQENFSSRSNFRLAVKRLLNVALSDGKYTIDGGRFTSFPLKRYPVEKSQFFYPEYYYFNISQHIPLIDIPRDEDYEIKQRSEIEHLTQQSEKINQIVGKAIEILDAGVDITLNDWITEIYATENDMDLAMHAGFELMQRTTAESRFNIMVNNGLLVTELHKLKLWNIKITKESTVF